MGLKNGEKMPVYGKLNSTSAGSWFPLFPRPYIFFWQRAERLSLIRGGVRRAGCILSILENSLVDTTKALWISNGEPAETKPWRSH